MPRRTATLTEMRKEQTYHNYYLSRAVSPHITPDQWRHEYGNDVDWLEVRYQKEKASENGNRNA